MRCTLLSFVLLAMAALQAGYAQAQRSTDPDVPRAGVTPVAMAPAFNSAAAETTILYGVADVGDESTQIFKIVAPGAFVALGPVRTGFDLEGIGIHPVTGDLYALSGGDGTTPPNFYKVDKATGDLTLIGNTGLKETLSASFNPVTHELWVYQLDKGLFTIDITNAAKTFKYLPTASGVDTEWEGLAWDPTGTFLYGTHAGKLYRTNPSTHATEVVCASGLPVAEALEFSPTGVLYGGLDHGSSASLRIFTVNIGACTAASSGFTGIPFSDIESLAFENICSAESCADDNPCTNDVCDPVEGCVHTPNTASCNDHDACTTNDTCSAGSCHGGPAPHCDDDNVCTTDSCDPAHGCTHTNNASHCNDGNACTANDRCAGGVCTPGAPTNCDDSNACTTDSCSPASGCAHGHVSCEDNNACTADSCDPATGCTHTPVSCDDSNACTTDSCSPASGCAHGHVSCDDQNQCTDDSCSPATGCAHSAVSCDDSNACTTDSCTPASGCAHGPVSCDDQNQCTADSCDPTTGCAHSATGCDDANACTTDTCTPASGCIYTPVDCDDQNQCTADSCDSTTGCAHSATGCDDANACTTDTCTPASGCIYTPVSCDDHDQCTQDSCSAATGCAHTPAVCDDGNACTEDSCDAETGCRHTTTNCIDHDKCTNDSCNPASGCVYTPVECGDGNSCTTDTCDSASGCAHTTLDCGDHDACTNDSCDPKSGCVHAAVECNDNNACTDDSCSAASGCVFTNNSNPCDDSSFCNGREVCTSGTCRRGAPLDCDDHDPCTNDCCASVGCLHTTVPECGTMVAEGCRVTAGGFTGAGTIDPAILASTESARFGGEVEAATGVIALPHAQDIQGFWKHERGRSSDLTVSSYTSLACGCDGLFNGTLCPHGPDHTPGTVVSPANMVCVSGIGELAGKNDRRSKRVAFRIEVEDRGQPAPNALSTNPGDIYRMRIWVPKANETAEGLAASVACSVQNPEQTVRAATYTDAGSLTGGDLTILEMDGGGASR